MPKATLLDSILGRPSQTYTSSGAYTNDTLWSPRAASEAGSASQVGSVLRSPSTRNGYSAARSSASRARRSRHPSGSDVHTLVPDMNTVNPFSRWWEERSQADASVSTRGAPAMAGPASTHATEADAPRAPAAHDSQEWQSWLRSFEQRRAETPHGATARHASASPPSQVYVPLTQDESGVDMSQVGYALTQDVPEAPSASLRAVQEEDESYGTMRFSSTPPITSMSRFPALAPPVHAPRPTSPALSAPADTRTTRSLRARREPARSTQPGDAFEALPDEELARLSWNALYLADNGLIDASPTKPTAQEEPRTRAPPERAPTSVMERATPLRRTDWEPVPAHPTRPVLEPSPVFREPAPAPPSYDLGAARRRRVEGLLRPLQDHRLSALSVSESVREELSPDVAPWTTNASVLGHLERSELHGTAEANPPTPRESVAAPWPVTPSALPSTATTPSHTTTRRMLDRPRQRGPRPTALGGIQIAHGTLPAPTPGHTPRRSVSDQVATRSASQVPPMPPLRHVSDTRVPRDEACWTDEVAGAPPTLPTKSYADNDVYATPPAAMPGQRPADAKAPAVHGNGAWPPTKEALHPSTERTRAPSPANAATPRKALATSPIPGLAPPVTSPGGLTASPSASRYQHEEPLHTYQVYDADSIAPPREAPEREVEARPVPAPAVHVPSMASGPTLPYLATSPSRAAMAPTKAPAPLSPVQAPAPVPQWATSPERYRPTASAPVSPYAMPPRPPTTPIPPVPPMPRPAPLPSSTSMYPTMSYAPMRPPLSLAPSAYAPGPVSPHAYPPGPMPQALPPGTMSPAYPYPQAYPPGPMSPGYPTSPVSPISPGAWVRPGPAPAPGWGPNPMMAPRIHMASPVRMAPPRAELVMPPSERDPANGMVMRRVSSTPDVSRYRPGALSDAGSLAPSRDPRTYLSPDMARRARTGADSDAMSMTTNARANTPLGRGEPSIAASTSVLSMSTAAAMKKAPLGASTNQYLSLSSEASAGGPGDSGSTRSPPSSSGRGHGLSGRLRPTDDLVRARPTMAAVQVTGAGAGSPASSAGARLPRRLSSSQLSRQRVEPEAHAMPPAGATGSISVVTSMASPRKVGSTQVIVQVIAVAIDRVDRALVTEKLHSENGSVFVPGRSFCGRIVEMGWDVKKLRMGDMVFGLQDLKKGGALAEFLCVDQDLLARAPEGRLSAEQICALPATGIMVHQIIQNHCMTLPRGARVLILQAHDNMGLLAMQEASRLGLVIVAQVPTQAADAVSICRANGAAEVITGEPLWSINLLHESSFQLVIDTIGGRAIYDACRRVLANNGQFVTCFGDGNGLPNPTHRSHLRSLRRSFFRKDRKVLGYEWVGIDATADHRAALESIKVAAQRGAISPRIQSVLPLEDAFRAFGSNDDGVVVVRVS